MTILVDPSDWLIIIPEAILVLTAIIILIEDAFTKRASYRSSPWIASIGAVLSIIAAILLWDNQLSGFAGMMVNDNFAVLVKVSILAATLLAVMISMNYVRREELSQGEYYALMLLSATGMLLMASSTNLVMVFLSLEVLSISLYVLAGVARARSLSREAALKYFLLGSFASAFFVYGVAMIYGAAGTLDLNEISLALAVGGVLSNPILLAGAGLVLVGLGFKVAVVPFQMWTPDVYEGAPSTVAAFMSVGSKAAAFAALTRVFVFALDGLRPEWLAAVWVIAVLTMIVGNLVAVVQDNIKRLLAYSSIAHAGYILIGIIAANDLGVQSIAFYLVAYAFMNLGAWAVVTAVTRKGEEAVGLSDYSGLFWSHPVLAGSMGLFMFALAGLPPTSGFMAKLYIFAAAFRADMIGLVIIAVLTTIISAYYYLRVTVVMFMQRPAEPPTVTVPAGAAIAIAIAAIATVWLFLFPNSTGAFTESVARLLTMR